MRVHLRPQIEPDRHWYASAYLRAVKRTVAAVVLTFWLLQESLPELIRVVNLSVTGTEVLPMRDPDPRVVALVFDAVPYSLDGPYYVRLVEYAAGVFQGIVGTLLVAAGLIALLCHLVVSFRRQ